MAERFTKSGRAIAAIVAFAISLTQTQAFASPPPAPFHGTPTALPGSSSSPIGSPGSGGVGSIVDLSSPFTTMRTTNSQTVNIQVGGTASATTGAIAGGTLFQINPSQSVTAAQYLAAGQIVNTGRQSLMVGTGGIASGGFASFVAGSALNISALTVPKQVNIFATGFGSQTPFTVTGAVNVLGALHALQTAPGLDSVLNFGSLTVAPGGKVSGNLPANASFLTDVFASRALSINVGGLLQNHGEIVNDGHLSITAGGVIENSSLNGVQATIAGQSVGLITGGGLINSGVISGIESVNVKALAVLQDLSVQNTGGIIQSLGGTLNFGDVLNSSALKVATTVTGGQLLATEVNVKSASGIVNVQVDNISGKLNINAGEAHVVTNSPNLMLGKLNLSGDPTFYNAGGNVQITGDLIFSGQALAIIASQNITTDGLGAYTLDTSGATGGNILLVSGANITDTGTGGTSGSNNTTSTLTISGGNTAGGKIDLTGPLGISSITSGATSGSAGSITLVSFAGTNPDSGRIILPSSMTINSQSSGAGNSSGAVTMIAGAQSGTAISGGAINTTGNTGADSGAVLLTASTPSGSTVTVTNGVLSGIFTPVSSSGTASISVSSIFAGTSPISINTPGALTLGGDLAGSVITLSAGAGGISQSAGTALSTPSLILTLANGGTAQLTQAGNNVQQMSATGTGLIQLDNGLNALVLNSLGSSNLAVSRAGAITTNSNNHSLSGLSLTGDSINITSNLTSSGDISLNSTSADGTGVTFDLNIGGLLVGNGASTSLNSLNNDIRVTCAITGTSAKYLSAANGHVQLEASVIGPSVSISASNEGIIQTNGSVTTTGSGLTLNQQNGLIALNAGFNNINQLTAIGGATILLNNGGNDIALNNVGATNLSVTNADAITTNATNANLASLSLIGTSVTISHDTRAFGNILLNASEPATPGRTDIVIAGVLTSNGAETTVTSVNNDILVSGVVNGTGNKNFTALNGSIQLQGGVSGAAVSLRTGNEGITQLSGTVIATVTGLTVELLSGGIADLSTGSNQVNQLTASGTGTILLNNGGYDLQLNNLGASNVLVTNGGAITTSTANLALAALSLSGTSITVDHAITSAGTISLTATGAASAGTVDVTINAPVLGTTSGTTTSVQSINNDILIANSVAGPSDKVISALNGAIALQGIVSGGSVSINAGNEGIVQNSAGLITATGSGLFIGLNSGGIADLSVAGNTLSQITAFGNGQIILNNNGNNLALNSLGSSNLVVTNGGAITTNVANATLTGLNLTGTSVAITQSTTSAGDISLTATGSASPGTADILISAPVVGTTAGSNTTLTSTNNDVAVTSSITGASNKSLSALNGSLAIGASVSGGSITLSASNEGISQTAGALTTSGTGLMINLVNGGAANLTSTSNNANELGATGNGVITLNNGGNDIALNDLQQSTLILLNAGNVTTKATNTALTGLTVTGTSVAISHDTTSAGVLSIHTTGAASGTPDITITGVLTGDGPLTSVVSDNNSIALGGSVTGDSVLLSAQNGGIEQTAGTVTATTDLTLVAGTSIGAAGSVTVNAPQLTANAGGSAYITDTASAVNLNGPSSANSSTGIFNLQTPNLGAGIDLTNGPTGTITAGSIVLNSINGFSLTAELSGTNSIDLTAGSSIANTDFASINSLTTSTLTMTSGGSVGTGTTPLNTVAGQLSVFAGTDVFINNNAITDVGDGAAGNGNTFSITTNGQNITASGTITGSGTDTIGLIQLDTTNNASFATGSVAVPGTLVATDVVLISGSGNLSTVSLSGEINSANTTIVAGSGPNSVSLVGGQLTATDSISIIAGSISSSDLGTNTLTTTNLIITTTTGSIGVDGAPILTQATNVSLLSTDNVFIQNNADTNIVGAAAGDDSTFSVTTNGQNIVVDTTVAGSVPDTINLINLDTTNEGAFTTGTITLTSNGVLIADNIKLTAGNTPGSVNASAGTVTAEASLSITAGTINNSDFGPNSPLDSVALSLIATNGSVGSQADPVNVATDNLYVSATGSAYINDSDDLTLTGATVGTGAGDTFHLVENGNLIITGPVSGNTIDVLTNPNGTSLGNIDVNASVTSTGPTNSVAFVADNNFTSNSNGPISGDVVSITAVHGVIDLGAPVTGMNNGTVNLTSDGTITGDAVSQVTTTTLNLESGTGIGTVSDPVITGATNLTLNTPGSAVVETTNAVNLGTSAIGGQLDLTGDVSITTTGNVTMDHGTITTPILINTTDIEAIGSNATLNVNSPTNGSIDVSGGGNLISTDTLNINSPNGDVVFSGDQGLIAPNININALNGTVQINPPAQLTIDGHLTVNTGTFFGNPDTDLILLPGSVATIDFAGSGVSMGTIANRTGDVILTNNMFINTGGKNLAILAQGNVIANGVGMINLGSSTDRSGSLSVFAGFDFAPTQSSTSVFDKTTNFTVTGPSSIGGSINLATTAISTSNFGSNPTRTIAGNVLMVAHAGSLNAGTILTGNITTNSINGLGGGVTLYGQGGVRVNGGITTSGATGSGAVNVGGANATTLSSFHVYNGLAPPSTAFTTIGPTSGSGAGVMITGPVNTTSTKGAGGAVNLFADANVQTMQGITTSGAISSGAVTIASLNGAVAIGGSIVTSGSNIFIPSTTTNAANGANVSIFAPASIAVSGNIFTNGASTVGTGNAGKAGTVTVQTSTRNNSNNLFDGNISITGAINATGGNAKTTTGGKTGGAGAAVTLKAGSMQVQGQVFANGKVGSIITTGGVGFTGTGTNGSVTIETYAVQSLPSNFNLTSKTASEIALPGALFMVGNATINGTAGNIVNGTASATSVNAGGVDIAHPFGPVGSGISITAKPGMSNSINKNGNTVIINPGTTNANRAKVTPAEAVALYQKSFNGTQTIGLNSFGQITDNGSLSLISLPQFDLPQAFSAFVLTTAQGAQNGVKLDVSGKTPILNISGAFTQTINGELAFSSLNNIALINAGGTQFKVAAGAKVSAAGFLALQGLGSPWVNEGTISAGSDILLLNPGGALNLTNKGVMTGTQLRLPSNGSASSFTYTNKSNAPGLALSLSPMQLPTGFGAVSASLTRTATSTGAVSLMLNSAGANGPMALTGNVTSGLAVLTVTTQADATTPTALNINGSFNVDQVLSINGGGAVNVSAGSQLTSNSALILTAPGLTVGANSTLSGTNAIIINLPTGDLNVTQSAISSANGVAVINTNGSGNNINFGAGSSVTGKFAVIMGSNGGAMSLGASGPLSSFSSSSGAMILSAKASINMANSQVNGQSALIATAGGAINDAGGEILRSLNGVVIMTAQNGVNIGAGTAVSAKAFAGLTGGQGAMTLGSGSTVTAAVVSMNGANLNATNTSVSGTNSLVINTTAGITATGSTFNATSGAVIFGANGGSSSIAFGQGSSVSGQFGVIMNTSGGLALGAAGGPQSNFTSSGGVVSLNAGGVMSVDNATVTGKFALIATGSQIVDGGGNTLGSTAGAVILTGMSGLTLGAGSNVTSPSLVILSANTGMMNLGGAASQLSVQSSGSLIVNASGGLTMNRATLSGANMLSVTAGTANITDSGSSQLLSSTGINIGGTNIAFGNGTAVTALGPSGVSVNALGTLGLGGGGTLMTVKAQTVNLMAAGDITASAAKLETTSVNRTLSVTSNNGRFEDVGGSIIGAAGMAKITAKTGASVGVTSSSNFSSGKGLSITATGGGIALGSGSLLSTASGNLAIQAQGTVMVEANLSAGLLPVVPIGKLLNSDVTSSGSISIVSGTATNAGGLTLGSGRTITANGRTTSPGHISIMVQSGNVDLGSGNTLTANGGNLTVYTTGSISGTTNNAFVAKGIAVSAAQAASSVGGVIEFSAGSTTSQMTAAMIKTPGTLPASTSLLGTPAKIVINNPTPTPPPGTGVVQVNVDATTGGTVNLTSGGTNTATLNLNGGGIIFNVSKGQSVQLDGATFTVSSYKAVGYTYGVAPVTQLMIAGDGGKAGGLQGDYLANLFVAGATGAQALAADCEGADAGQDSNDSSVVEIDLLSGEMFINPLRQTVIHCNHGDVFVRKGALVSIVAEDESMTVASCSGPGDVVVQVAQHRILLAPGQEAKVSSHVDGAAGRADGVGRRNAQTVALTKGLHLTTSDFSIVSMMSNVVHMQTLIHPTTSIEKRISDRLLKAAAAVQQLTSRRGAYTARPAIKRSTPKNQTLVLAN